MNIKEHPLYIIATELLGYVEDTCPPDYNGESGGTLLLVPDGTFIDRYPHILPLKGEVHPFFLVPKLNQSLEAALMLVTAMSDVEIETNIQYSLGQVSAGVMHKGKILSLFTGNQPDLPDMITRAIAWALPEMTAKQKRLIRQQYLKA